jgi:hypothetical protein
MKIVFRLNDWSEKSGVEGDQNLSGVKEKGRKKLKNKAGEHKKRVHKLK